MPLSQAEPYLDHLTSCSPCYRDFLELQQQYRQRRTQMIFAVAASVLIVAGLATWAMLQHNQQIAHVVVDLRDRSMARGTEPPLSEPPLEIPRNVSRLEIYLPLGSSEGPYEVRVASIRGEPLVSGSGEARIKEGLTLLPVDLKFSLDKSAKYLLQVRKQGSEWVSFALQTQ